VGVPSHDDLGLEEPRPVFLTTKMPS
jgi:hypothetical protein